MNQSFEKAFEEIFTLEGGFTDDPNDKGNWTGGVIGKGELKGTKYGISAMSYPHLDIKDLTLQDAKQIYWSDWWTAYNYDRLESQAIAAKTFNHAMNMHPRNGHRILQRGCRACGVYTLDDGLIGRKTIYAANTCDPDELLTAMRSEAAGLYRLFISVDKRKKKYRKGWLRRAYDDRN